MVRWVAGATVAVWLVLALRVLVTCSSYALHMKWRRRRHAVYVCHLCTVAASFGMHCLRLERLWWLLRDGLSSAALLMCSRLLHIGTAGGERAGGILLVVATMPLGLMSVCLLAWVLSVHLL